MRTTTAKLESQPQKCHNLKVYILRKMTGKLEKVTFLHFMNIFHNVPLKIEPS